MGCRGDRDRTAPLTNGEKLCGESRGKLDEIKPRRHSFYSPKNEKNVKGQAQGLVGRKTDLGKKAMPPIERAQAILTWGGGEGFPNFVVINGWQSGGAFRSEKTTEQAKASIKSGGGLFAKSKPKTPKGQTDAEYRTEIRTADMGSN